MSERIDNILEKLLVFGLSLYVIGSVFWTGVMHAGLGIAFLAWVISKVKNLNFKVKSSPLNKYILFFLLAAVLSFINSVDLARSVDHFRRYFIYPAVLFFMVIDLDVDTKLIKKWLGVIFIAMVISITYTFWQEFEGVRRPSAFNFVMEYVNLVMFTMIYTVIYSLWGEIKKRYRVLLALVSIMGLISLVFTRTRGAWLAVIFSFACLFYIVNKKYIVYFLIGLTLFFALAPIFVPQDYVDRFVSIFDLEEDSSNITRVELWEYSVELYKNNPIIGVGLHNFRNAHEVIDDLEKPAGNHRHAHNNFLQFAATTGTIGLIAFVLLFAMMIKEMYRYYKASKNRNLKLFFLANLTIIVGYLFNGLTNYNIDQRSAGRMLWFLVAISIVLAKRENLIKDSAMTEKEALKK